MTAPSPSEHSLPESSTSTGPTSDDIQLPVGEIDAGFIKRFREQVHALGVVWIVLGSFEAVPLFLPTNVLAVGAIDPQWVTIDAVLGLAWIALGAYSLEKNLWALKLGRVLCYLMVIANIALWISLASQRQVGPIPVSSLMTMAMVRLFIWGGVLLQCRRVIRWAKQMQQAGVPLTSRPVRTKA